MIGLGLGAALQTKILQNLSIAKNSEGPIHLHRAAELFEHTRETLAGAHPELKRLTIAGDFRRGCELVSDLSLVAETPGANEKVAALDSSGLKVFLADRQHFGAALL